MPEPDQASRPHAALSAIRSRDVWRGVDRLLSAWGPLLLLLFAVFYYGQYYRSGLNLSGEGGSTAVYAMRLNEGWLPIKETFLGYNVMWFYPVAWMFRLIGPDYIALRIYFFVLCWLAAVMAFLVVRRVSGRGWYALGVGLLVATIPGMLFRNYMGLLPLLNAWALLGAFVLEPRAPRWRWAWFAVAGAVLGITFLIRVEIGNFMLVIYAGLALLFPLDGRGRFRRRALVSLGGAALCAVVALGVQWPFYRDAQKRGYTKDFVEQYVAFWRLLPYEIKRRITPQAGTQPAGEGRIASRSSPIGVHPIRNTKRLPENWRELQARQTKQTLPRQELRDLFRQPTLNDAIFVLILHLPLLIAAATLLAAGIGLAWALLTANAGAREASLVSLVTLGCALTLFPQYFFFRPDTPHLSEFMVPFLVAMAVASLYAARIARRARFWMIRAAAVGFITLCVIGEGLYFLHSFPKESAGTIAAKRKRGSEFAAENNVRVRLKKTELRWMQGLHDAVTQHSSPDDWVVAFPYAPTINFMTNRRSYLSNLYVDNATAHPDFTVATIAEIKRRRPAVIVIDQRAINATEFSRFRNWASPTQNFIREHYVLIGVFDENEVYARPDKVSPRT